MRGMHPRSVNFEIPIHKFIKHTQPFMHWPFLSLLVIEVAFSLFLKEASVTSGIVFFLTALVLFFIHLIHKKTKRFLLFALVPACCFFMHHTGTKSLSTVITSKKGLYTALVSADSLYVNGYSKVIVDLTKRIQPVQKDVTGRVILTVGNECLFNQGDMIQFNAGIKEPTPYQNPGGFDYADHLKRNNIWGKAYVHACQEISLQKKGKVSLRNRVRHKILKPLNNPEYSPYGPVLSALLLGTKTISRENAELIRSAGLSHLFAISGSHFAVMCALIFFMVTLITDRFAGIYLKISKQKTASLFTLGFVSFYLFVVYPGPSVIRAGIMFAVYLFAILLERQKNILHVIIVSAVIILFLHPLDLFDVSFQLSYLCVLVLAVVYPHIHVFFKKYHDQNKINKIVSYSMQLCLVSILMNTMLLPLVLMEFGASPLSSFINNLWAIPLFDFVVMPLMLVYMLGALVCAPLSVYVLYPLNLTLAGFFKMLNLVASLGLYEIQSFAPHLEHVILFYIIVFFFFLTRNKKITALLSLLLLVLIGHTYYTLHVKYDLRITQIDVKQGDAIFVQTRDKNLLIDTGGSRFLDTSELAILPFLRYLWVNRLDYVIITHSDIDHFGGLGGMLGNMGIGEVWINNHNPHKAECIAIKHEGFHVWRCAPDTTRADTMQKLMPKRVEKTFQGFKAADPQYMGVLSELKNKEIPIRVVTEGDRISLDKQTTLTVLAPLKNMEGLEDDNDHSVVVKIERGNFSALFTGDISTKAENLLVKHYKQELAADYLKISHHGSRSATGKKFLDAVQPQIVSIGVEKNSRYGHPNREIINRLDQHRAEILRTDAHGAAGVRLKGDAITVWRYRNSRH
ncbi:MAG: DNA internalization-related competence protein ComEC/Rec2 [Deltaproteobacteria bacterium]|nr:DNA internalization-related competence protein ComEC/Rec2 [Deltaproteobacteria bacterium]